MSTQDDDPVGVGPSCIVSDAPAVRRLGELLLVHHHEQPVERETFRSVPDKTLGSADDLFKIVR